MRVEDLKDTGRLLGLFDRAVARDFVGPGEADRLRFVAAAEHALAVGQANPPGLFVFLVRGRRWRHLTQGDEERASRRLRLHLFGEASRPGLVHGMRAAAARRPSDAEVVGEVRAAAIRSGHFRDPFAIFARRNPGWTRERWDRALEELHSPRRETRPVLPQVAAVLQDNHHLSI